MKDDTLPEKSKEAIRFALDYIGNHLSDKFTYHTSDHTRRVISAAENLAESEGVDCQSVGLLLVAAAWHDCGYIINTVNHEKESCHLVKKFLPDFGFNEDQISNICEIIMATKITNRPHNLLQKIICDADLHYLGTDSYDHLANRLYFEMKHFGIINTLEEWIDRQINFLTNHRFFTETAQSLYDQQKMINLERLKILKEQDEYK